MPLHKVAVPEAISQRKLAYAKTSESVFTCSSIYLI